MNHVTIGVYANGEYKVNIVHPKDLTAHIEYNQIFRFGRGLFVDGKCVNQGYLSEEEVKKWEAKITTMTFNCSTVSKVYV